MKGKDAVSIWCFDLIIVVLETAVFLFWLTCVSVAVVQGGPRKDGRKLGKGRIVELDGQFYPIWYRVPLTFVARGGYPCSCI
jgi:hypothetical protein